jgi:hypothetical protein
MQFWVHGMAWEDAYVGIRSLDRARVQAASGIALGILWMLLDKASCRRVHGRVTFYLCSSRSRAGTGETGDDLSGRDFLQLASFGLWKHFLECG